MGLHPARRKEDKRGSSTGLKIVSAFACILAAFSILLSVLLFARINREGKDRRDQSCLVAERGQLKDVESLKQTYRLALHPPPELGKGLLKLIVQNLPQAEAEAKLNQAPKYCLEPGIGLPGDKPPAVPQRPPQLTP